jgi:hypothetical protein
MIFTCQRRWSLALWLIATAGLGCVTGRPEKPDAETLKPRIEDFHLRVRWRDFRGAAELLVPERRAAFLKARAEKHDEKDLSITDYQLEECVFATDGLKAECISNLSWVRLPSVSEERATVTSVFVWSGNTWQLAQQKEGPFTAELGAAYKPVEPPKP